MSPSSFIAHVPPSPLPASPLLKACVPRRILDRPFPALIVTRTLTILSDLLCLVWFRSVVREMQVDRNYQDACSV